MAVISEQPDLETGTPAEGEALLSQGVPPVEDALEQEQGVDYGLGPSDAVDYGLGVDERPYSEEQTDFLTTQATLAASLDNPDAGEPESDHFRRMFSSGQEEIVRNRFQTELNNQT